MKRVLKRAVQSAVASVAPMLWRGARRPSLLVLMYHRVLPALHPDRATEQPGMYVSPETFGMHMEVLRRHFELIHLDDWLDAVAAGRPAPPRACAITFDDGWRDNYEYAFPLLRETGTPATIYLVSDMVGAQYTFWPNRLAAMLARGDESIRGRALQAWLRQVAQRVGEPGPFAGFKDIDAAISLCKKACTDTEMVAALDGMEAAWELPTDQRNLANWEEVREMMATGLVRAGSHTRRHARLTAKLDPGALEDEIVQSAASLQSRLGSKPRTFCYPNGDYTPAAVALVRSHYAGAVTTQEGWNAAGSDRHLLRRVGVHEDVSCTPESFLSRLAGVG